MVLNLGIPSMVLNLVFILVGSLVGTLARDHK